MDMRRGAGICDAECDFDCRGRHDSCARAVPPLPRTLWICSIPQRGMPKMRFAFCIFAYFPYGGLQRDCMQLLRECRRRGHDVDLYTGEWEGAVPEDVSVHFVPSRALTNHGVNVNFARNLSKRLRHSRYDAVVGFNKMPGLDVYYAGDVCYASRVAHFSSVRRALPRYRRLIDFERAVFAPESSTEIILLARSQQDDYVRCYGTPAERFHIMPPDMPVDRLYKGDRHAARAAARERFQLAAEHRLILMVGSGFKAKGVDRAVRAIAALPEALRDRSRLVIVGDDNKAPYLGLAKSLGVANRVEFAGGQADVAPYYLAADLLIHPAYHEMTGTVLLEALGHGLPVLVTDTCGFAVHVQQAEAGEVLASPFDQRVLDERLAAMLDSPMRAQWGDNGVGYMNRLPLGVRPQRAADVLEQVAAGRAKREAASS